MPRFKAGDFDGGVMAGVSSIMEIVQGEYAGRAAREPASGQKGAPIFTLHLPLRHPRFCGRPFQDSRRSSGGYRPSCRRKALLSCPRLSDTGRHRGRRVVAGLFVTASSRGAGKNRAEERGGKGGGDDGGGFLGFLTGFLLGGFFGGGWGEGGCKRRIRRLFGRRRRFRRRRRVGLVAPYRGLG